MLGSGPKMVVKQGLLPTLQSAGATISLTLPSCSVHNHLTSHNLKS